MDAIQKVLNLAHCVFRPLSLIVTVALLIAGGMAMPVQAQVKQMPGGPLPKGPALEPRQPGLTPAGPAPTRIAVSVTQTTATLIWNAVPGASGYEVYRAGGVRVTPPNTTAPEAVDRGLAPGMAYTWTVAAIYPDRRPGNSAPVSAITKPPVNPTGFTATATGNHVALRWSPVPEASFYWLQGPGLSAPQKLVPWTISFPVTNVPRGTHQYLLIAYYESGGQHFADENNPARASVTVTTQPKPTASDVSKPVAALARTQHGPFYVCGTRVPAAPQGPCVVSTGVRVRKGSQVEVSSFGEINFGGAVLGYGAPVLDPNGDSWQTPSDYPAAHLRKNSLILKVDSTFYQGGTQQSFRPTDDGELILQPNDKDMNDNRGVARWMGGRIVDTGWVVNLSVTEPQ